MSINRAQLSSAESSHKVIAEVKVRVVKERKILLEIEALEQNTDSLVTMISYFEDALHSITYFEDAPQTAAPEQKGEVLAKSYSGSPLAVRLNQINRRLVSFQAVLSNLGASLDL